MLLWSALLLLNLHLIFRKMAVCWLSWTQSVKIHLNATRAHTHPSTNGSLSKIHHSTRLRFAILSISISILPANSIYGCNESKLYRKKSNIIMKMSQQNKTKRNESEQKDFNICLVFINFDEIVYNNIKFHVGLM